ncbi:MAG: cell division protein FtsA [Xanthomonadales bacterium]|jgi:cell division protein FtsA|nr:cell division protein FtsA [Xanthomonadales bacterium]
MTKKPEKSLVVGLDIGTSKVVAIVGEIQPDGSVEVIGLGSHASRGLRRGVVVDMASTEQAIARAVEEAELMAGCEIHSVFCGISGNHIRSQNSDGTVAIKDKEVTEQDVDRVLEAARAIPLAADQQILHVLPQEYVLDRQDGIRQPIGMAGVRLEAHVHVVTAALAAVQNVGKCVTRNALTVDEPIITSLASSYSALSDDERELGVCLMDIGAGTTDIAVFTHGAIRHTACLPIAGDQVTNDLAVALRTPTQHAEDIKIKYGCALEQLAGSEETIQVPSVGERTSRRLARQTLAQVVEARYRELFSLVNAELRRSGYENLVSSGLVLTGGAAKVEGAVDLAEEVFHMPVRLATPQYVTGLSDVVSNPVHATGVGLLIYGSQVENAGRRFDGRSDGMSLVDRVKTWFRGEF